MFLEAAKVEAAKNTIANLTGKLDAMQAQIERQGHELEDVRQGAKKVSEEAAELRGKLGVSVAQAAPGSRSK